MSLTLTEKARKAAESNIIQPNLVLEIDGVTDKFGALSILKYIRIGDAGLVIGDTWVIGGTVAIEDQQTVISFDGTTTSISQKVDVDKGSGSSVSQMSVALVDIGDEITRLITPGEIVTDILARKATVWLGFSNVAFPDDYIRIFRGVIDDVTAGVGKITLQLSHPDQKKRQDIFIKAESQLDGAIGSGDTTINLISATNFFEPITGPDGLDDSEIQYGLRIEDEIIFYTEITGNQLTGVTRGQLGTTAAAHADETDVEAFIRFGPINAIDAALKIMLSGWNGPYESGVDIKNFELLGDLTTVDNSIFFQGVDVADVYGVVSGDYITTTGASNGANNVTLKQIDQVIKTDEGSYIVVNDVDFVQEIDSAGVIDFRSKYDTLHPGCGLKLHNNEVDISDHERIQRWFLSSFEYDFYMRDTVNGKEFIEQQIYFPAAAYSLPRKAKASLGYHIGPLPTSDIKQIDVQNTVGASKVSIKRSIARNFYNTIVYKYEEKVLEEDKFLRGNITTDATSKTQIPVGTRALVIPAKGVRQLLGGASISSSAANRRIRRYKFAAEYIEGLQVSYGDSYNVEIGDIILLDLASLQMADTKNATRTGEPRLFEIYNKTFDLKTGQVKLSIIDTSYSTATRYCLMAPSSKIITATTTVLTLRPTGNSLFGSNEGGKWSRYIGAKIRVKNTSYSNQSTSTIQTVLGNTVTLETPLSFTPAAEDTLILADYNEMPDDEISARLKLIYGFMRDSNFGDGSMQYQMI